MKKYTKDIILRFSHRSFQKRKEFLFQVVKAKIHLSIHPLKLEQKIFFVPTYLELKDSDGLGVLV